MGRFGRRRRVLLATGLLMTPLRGDPAEAGPGPQHYDARLAATSFVFSPGAGVRVRDSLLLYSRGATTAFVTTTQVTHRLAFLVEADQCEGAPRLEAAVDGVTLVSRSVYGRGVYAAVGTWPAGRHQVTFRFLNDRVTPVCDRNVTVADARLSAYAGGAVRPVDGHQILPVDPTTTTVTPTAAATFADADPAPIDDVPAAPARVVLHDDGVIDFRLDSQGARYLALNFRSAVCDDHLARVLVTLDGSVVYDGELVAPLQEGWVTGVGAQRPFTNGDHEVTVAVSGVRAGDCTRSLSFEGAIFRGLV